MAEQEQKNNLSPGEGAENEERKSPGALWGVIIIVIVLALGAWYFIRSLAG